jgi:hypothetical protein
MIGRLESILNGVELQDSGDDPSYPKSKEVGISETTPKLKG